MMTAVKKYSWNTIVQTLAWREPRRMLESLQTMVQGTALRATLRTLLVASAGFVGAAQPDFRRLIATLIAIPVLCALTAPPVRAQPMASVAARPATIDGAAPPSIATVARRALPAVVDISVIPGSVDGGGQSCGEATALAPEAQPGFSDEVLRRSAGWPVPAGRRDRTGEVQGSGFVIDPSGLIVTSFRLVARAGRIDVLLADGSRHAARLLGDDEMTDLALLKIEAAAPLPALDWGDSHAMHAGDWIIAAGGPFGLAGTLRLGRVAALDRELGFGPYDDFLQIDAAINPGDSGSPDLDLAGRVVGINSRMYAPTGGSIGLAFATPSSLARSVIDQRRRRGRVVRSWLGVTVQEVTPAIARGLGLVPARGAIVDEVTEDGPAASAGLRLGDVITGIGGDRPKRAGELPLIVAQTPIGGTVRLRIWRAGRKRTIDAVTAEMPGAARERRIAGAAEQDATRLGLTFSSLATGMHRKLHLPHGVTGVVIAAIAADSPLSADDIAPCDVVETIDRQPVATPQQAAARLDDAWQPGEPDPPVLFLLNRHGVRRFLAVSMPPVDEGCCEADPPSH